MPRKIDPATLSRADATAMLAQAIEGDNMARLAAGISRGAHKRHCIAIGAQHSRNAIALADRLYGAPSADVAAMSDDEILASLIGA